MDNRFFGGDGGPGETESEGRGVKKLDTTGATEVPLERVTVSPLSKG